MNMKKELIAAFVLGVVTAGLIAWNKLMLPTHELCMVWNPERGIWMAFEKDAAQCDYQEQIHDPAPQ